MSRKPDLSRLLRPRSIAVFGSKQAAEAVRQSDRIGFDGEIWPVHPRHDEVAGHRAYRSVADLPGVPDACFLGINRHLTVETIPQLAAMGAGGAVVFSSGYAESGEAGLQARLVEGAGDMPFLGPNCYGFINYLDGALLWPDQHGGQRVERGVAIITQSGNIGLNLTMQRRALPVAYLITLGNQAVVGLAEMIEALLDDPRVTAIGLHIEGIGDAAAFSAAASKARQRGVPLVALKTGKSAAGARLTISHTASLAGADAVIDAFLRRAGVARVASIPVLLETLKILHLLGPLKGRDIASMSCSGGEAALIADLAEDSGVRFRPLTEPQAARVAATLSELVTVSNPLDYHTFSWADEVALTQTFAAMMAADFDITLLILDFPREDRCDGADWMQSVKALANAARASGKPAGVAASLPESMPEARALEIAAMGIVPFSGIDDALAAIAAVADPGSPLNVIPGLDPGISRQLAAKLARDPRVKPGDDGFRGGDDRARMVAAITPPPPEGGGREEGAFQEDMDGDAAVDGITALSRHTAPPPPPGRLPRREEEHATAIRTLTEWEGKQRLAAYSVTVPEGRLVQTIDAAETAAIGIGFPIVLKAIGASLTHKSELGAVKLGLKDPASVRAAAEALIPLGEALLVESMVPDAVAELIIGIDRDPALGLYLVIGSGGVLAELLADRQLLMLPASEAEIRRALSALKLAPLLQGYRGRPVGDIDAAIAAILAIQNFAIDHADRLMELDMNPLMVRPAGLGAVAADVLMRLAEEEQ